MKNLLLLCMSLCSFQLYSMEIAIDLTESHPCLTTQDGWGKTQTFIPVVLYKKEKCICFSYIPQTALEQANNGDTIYDGSDGSGNVYRYICRQSNAQPNHTFAQALRVKLEKERRRP